MDAAQRFPLEKGKTFSKGQNISGKAPEGLRLLRLSLCNPALPAEADVSKEKRGLPTKAWLFQINIWFHNLQAIQQGWGRKSPGGKAGTAALLNRNRRREAAAIGGAERFGKSPGRAEAFASIHSDSIEKTLCCLSVWERGNLAGAKSSTLARTQGINFR